MLAVGSNQGELILMQIQTKETHQSIVFDTSQKILQILGMPEYVGKDASQNTFYIRTNRNVYCARKH